MSYLFSYSLTPFFTDQFFHPFLPLSLKMGYKCDVIYECPYIGAGGWEGKRGIRFSFLEQLGVLYTLQLLKVLLFEGAPVFLLNGKTHTTYGHRSYHIANSETLWLRCVSNLRLDLRFTCYVPRATCAKAASKIRRAKKFGVLEKKAVLL